MLLPRCGTTALPAWHGVIPRAQEEVASGQGVECKRSWLCPAAKPHLPSSLSPATAIKIPPSGLKWGEAGADLFSGGRGRTKFSAGMDLFLEQDQEMSPPHLSRGRKITGRNCKNNQHGVLRFPEGIRGNELSWERGALQTNLQFSISLSEPWPRAITGDDFLVKLREPSLQGCRWDSSLAPGSKVEQWEKTSWRWKVVKAREPEWNPEGGSY